MLRAAPNVTRVATTAPPKPTPDMSREAVGQDVQSFEKVDRREGVSYSGASIFGGLLETPTIVVVVVVLLPCYTRSRRPPSAWVASLI